MTSARDNNSDITSAAVAILDHVERGDLDSVFSRADVRNKFWTGLDTTKKTQDALDYLVKNKAIIKVKNENGNITSGKYATIREQIVRFDDQPEDAERLAWRIVEMAKGSKYISTQDVLTALSADNVWGEYINGLSNPGWFLAQILSALKISPRHWGICSRYYIAPMIKKLKSKGTKKTNAAYDKLSAAKILAENIYEKSSHRRVATIKEIKDDIDKDFPWCTFPKGKPIAAYYIARMLSKIGIVARLKNGYAVFDFSDAAWRPFAKCAISRDEFTRLFKDVSDIKETLSRMIQKKGEGA